MSKTKRRGTQGRRSQTMSRRADAASESRATRGRESSRPTDQPAGTRNGTIRSREPDLRASPGNPDRSRAALNRFLKDSGFATRGDLVLVEPSASETREIRRSEKAVVATISTRARDRHGDIVDPAGVRLERYRKNPVVLWAHDYEALPVARSLWERVRGSDGGGSELIAKPQFHLDTELSREVWALLEKGVLSAWSVGFLPEEWDIVRLKGNPPGPALSRSEGDRLRPADAGRETRSGGVGHGPSPSRPADRPGGTARVEGGLAPGAGGEASFIVKKWDLLEYSCVPVPANFEALTHELKARRITAPALVKTLGPLGLRAPDLVSTPVVARRDSLPKPAQADGETKAEGETDRALPSRPLSGRGETSPEKRCAAGSRSSRGTLSRSLRASLLKKAVERAFERVLRRARGEGC